jgi:hypothetical protein
MLNIYGSNGALIQVLAEGFLLIGRQVFTTTGPNTYTPTTGTRAVLVELIGGGAGGFNTVNSTAGQLIAAGGGASGAYSAKFLSILATDVFQAFVGAGGGTSGGNGSVSTFTDNSNSAILCSAPGGSAGTTVTTGTAETYGTNGGGTAGASIGDIGFDNNKAQLAHRVSATLGMSGRGGSGPHGGRPVSTIAHGNGAAGVQYGSGGNGGVSINAAGTTTGGAGGQGIAIVWEFTR